MARILQTHVSALYPPAGPVKVMLFGEAPGPRGADQSGIPFWGDRAGASVYRALEAAGLAQVPPGAYLDWDGARFRAEGLAPVLHGAALSNAYPRCPTRDFQTFRAPTDAELLADANQARLLAELEEAASRCPGRLRVIAMGRRAQWVFGRLERAPHRGGAPGSPSTFIPCPTPPPRASSRPPPARGRA